MNWADQVTEESGTLRAQDKIPDQEVAQTCYVAHELTDTKPEERP